MPLAEFLILFIQNFTFSDIKEAKHCSELSNVTLLFNITDWKNKFLCQLMPFYTDNAFGAISYIFSHYMVKNVYDTQMHNTMKHIFIYVHCTTSELKK